MQQSGLAAKFSRCCQRFRLPEAPVSPPCSPASHRPTLPAPRQSFTPTIEIKKKKKKEKKTSRDKDGEKRRGCSHECRVRESPSEKERDAKFLVTSAAFSPAPSSHKYRDRRDAARPPLTWLARHLPAAGRLRGRLRWAPGLSGSAAHPSPPRLAPAQPFGPANADGGLGRPRRESPERLIQLYPWYLSKRREEKAQLVLFSSRFKRQKTKTKKAENDDPSLGRCR